MPNLIKAPNIKMETQGYKLSASIEAPKCKNKQSAIEPVSQETVLAQEQQVEKTIKDADHRATIIVSQAQEQANGIILNAKKSAVQEFEIAKKTGFQEGLVSGKQEIQQELSSKLEEVANALGNIQKRENEFIKNYEQEILGLAISIARKIIFSEITIDHQLIINMVNDTIRYFKNYKWIKLHVAGCDSVSQVLTDPAAAQMLLRDFQNIEVIVLPNAPAGSCVIETDKEIVDIGVDSQLSALAGEFSKYSSQE
ncbi:MAG: FliH/SctL family protein [Oscillospiraceae bacterium]